MSLRVTACGEVNLEGSRSESESERGVQSRAVDAKPGELSLGRLKQG